MNDSIDDTRLGVALSKRMLSAAALGISLCLSVGCSKKDESIASDGSTPKFADAEPFARNDAIGATAPDLKAGALPEHIASATLLGDEILWNLGDTVRSRVVAVSKLADDPQYSAVAGLWPHSHPRLAASVEDYLLRHVDLAIVANFTDENVKHALRDRLTLVELDDFSGHDAYLTNLAAIGAAVGAKAQADLIRDAFLQARTKIEARTAHDAEQLRKYFQRKPRCLAWNYDHSPGKKTTFDDAATLAGCENATATAGLVGHQRIDAESVVAWDVDIFVLACEPGQDCEGVEALFAARPGHASIRAIAQGNFATVPSHLLSTTGAHQLDLATELHDRILGLSKRPLSGRN
jgi:ABC-type Fe3+-hydroxamate transport system substrate-binding protein